MVSKQNCKVFLEPEQKFNFRGVWNPNDGDPILPTKYDAYIVDCNTGDYEVGDWIVRDKHNKYWTHVKISIYSKLMEYISSDVAGRFALDKANLTAHMNQVQAQTFDILNKRIDELEEAVRGLKLLVIQALHKEQE